MENLYQKRNLEYRKKLLKYLRLVFNDHFVLAILFLFGGISLNYANFLRQIDTSKVASLVENLIIIFLLLFMQFGKFTTLLKRPDILFLAPKEYELPKYLRKAFRYSLFINIMVQILLYLVIVPLLLVIIKLNNFELLLLLMCQIFLKYMLCKFQYYANYFTSFQSKTSKILFNWITPLAVYLTFFYISKIVGFIFALSVVIVTVFFESKQNSSNQKKIFLWRYAIEQQEAHLVRIYHFFNLFTDVPNIKSAVKRRKYLDYFLPSKGGYLFLYTRGFVRNNQYFNLWMRLICLAVAFELFVNNFYLGIFLGILFIYLIGFQILPLRLKYDDIVFTHIYPIKTNEKNNSFEKIVFNLIMLSNIILSISIGIGTKGLSLSIISFIVFMVEDYLLTKFYLKLRFKNTEI